MDYFVTYNYVANGNISGYGNFTVSCKSEITFSKFTEWRTNVSRQMEEELKKDCGYTTVKVVIMNVQRFPL